MSKPTEYENAIVEKYLKETIVCESLSKAIVVVEPALIAILAQAQALYSEKYPGHQKWEVVIAKENGYHLAHVIVYKEPNRMSGKWVTVDSTSMKRNTKAALAELLERLQTQLPGYIETNEKSDGGEYICLCWFGGVIERPADNVRQRWMTTKVG
ncbi:hypothetical protein EJ02DRAFT_420366 [Clathrospora elynae]|uniref:Uncharacterized protein n=1 Tax=Clathrospora elynae TaxID=706981 RepID=A0A6A5SXV3_9PLEO|nr:hypothetical protein EJ02DRAFT_420366 [Clathrospora elynae]